MRPELFRDLPVSTFLIRQLAQPGASDDALRGFPLQPQNTLFNDKVHFSD